MLCHLSKYPLYLQQHPARVPERIFPSCVSSSSASRRGPSWLITATDFDTTYGSINQVRQFTPAQMQMSGASSNPVVGEVLSAATKTIGESGAGHQVMLKVVDGVRKGCMKVFHLEEANTETLR